jgi:hypothetical protein
MARDEAPKISSCSTGLVRKVGTWAPKTTGAGAFSVEPSLPRARISTSSWEPRASMPSRQERAMPGVSMVAPSASASTRPTAARNASPASPSGTNSRPGLVHSCPEEPVREVT